MVVVSTLPLKSLEEIKEHFGVGSQRVREWVDAGCPEIVVLRNSKGEVQGYKSEYHRLLTWVSEYERSSLGAA